MNVSSQLGRKRVCFRDLEQRTFMQSYFASLTMVLLIGMVVTRVVLLRRIGIQAMQFGKLDKTDFLIVPFTLLYFYCVFALTFNWLSRTGTAA